MPERNVLETHDAVGSDHSSHAAQSFGDYRIALVRHCARSLLTLRETLLSFADFSALPVTNVQGKLIQRRGDKRESAQIFSVDISLNDLRRDRRSLQAQSLANFIFDLRVQVSEGAHCPTYFSYRHCFPGTNHPLALPSHFVVPERER